MKDENSAYQLRKVWLWSWALKWRERSKSELQMSLRVSSEGMTFLLKPRIRTACRTFSSLLRWSRLICFTMVSYQSVSSGGSLMIRAICSSTDSFTGNALLPAPFSPFPLPFPVPSSFRSCWFSWKSRKAYFLGLVALQSCSGREGSSISSRKNHPLRMCLISAAASFPAKNLIVMSKFLRIGASPDASSKGSGTCSRLRMGSLRCTSRMRSIYLYLVSRLSSSLLAMRCLESWRRAEVKGSCRALMCREWYCLAFCRSPKQQ